MKEVLPWSVREIEDTARSLIGSSLTSVRYLLPESSSTTERESRAGYDDADMGVEFTQSNGNVLTALWFMDGVKEGLGLVQQPAPEYYELRLLKSLDVSYAREWKHLMKSPIGSVRLGWHLPDDPSLVALWSLALVSESGGAAVVVGEEERYGELPFKYQPDNVLAIFDVELAQNFGGPGTLTPAWGEVLSDAR